MKYISLFLIGFVVITLAQSKEISMVQTRSLQDYEDRSIWDQMSALARLPGDLMRKDFISLLLDAIIVTQFLPLPWIIATFLSISYRVLKFIQPAYWWLFPSTKPPNVQGYGFAKLF